ncbi:MAG: RagB/SusD family nutrient uptake outer membrane protein [Muribaculaceae bacterium]|nr:RagB/SusD family nutrient uptake outer membrane protein [Muribaculaceae bacterium]MBR5119248.1 RagB/SusD family nutrient uptake outer membrane protein [Muribaculaceae bacterium]
MKYLSFIISAIALMVCPSCDKFLEENPNDRIPDQEAYSSEGELYRNAVASLYALIGGNTNSHGLQGTGRGVYDLNTFTTDEAIMPTRGADWYDGGFWQDLFSHQWGTSNGAIDGTWDYLFLAIIKCNESLEHIKAFLEQHPSNDNAAEWQAEVRGLRAMFYFYAMDLYGRVPVFTKSSPEVADMKLQPRSTTFNFIRSELLDILPLLSYNRSNKHGEYYGRFTHSVASFLLAKLALNAEVYCHDNWTNPASRPSGNNIEWNIYGNKVNTWEAAVYFCDNITSYGYTLDDYFSQPFAVNNENSAENIFIIPMDKHLYTNVFIYLFRSRHYNHAAALGLNGENGSSATIEALNTFGYGTDDVDPRFAATYYADEVFDYDGNLVLLDDGTPLVYEPWKVAPDVSAKPWEKTAGARMRKYEIDLTATKDGTQSDNDIVLFRYADVLLMKAEALVRNGQNGDAPLNQVRDRAGAPHRTATLASILDERMLELAWEGWRRNDLVRFGLFTRSYTDRPQLPGESTNFTIVFPIPGKVLALTGDSQNPGY